MSGNLGCRIKLHYGTPEHVEKPNFRIC
jgi:hypothetical protein